jgi:hypothetical protein
MIKNKHKSGNNISSSDKIMINSSEVHFNITSQYQKLGSKIIIFYASKNHLGRFVNNTT